MPDQGAEPSVISYLILAIGGFAIGAFGNLVRSRILIGIGILMIYAGLLVYPVYDYLRQ